MEREIPGERTLGSKVHQTAPSTMQNTQALLHPLKGRVPELDLQELVHHQKKLQRNREDREVKRQRSLDRVPLEGRLGRVEVRTAAVVKVWKRRARMERLPKLPIAMFLVPATLRRRKRKLSST